MAERILRAYFSEGQDITQVEILAQLAAEVGLEADRVKHFNFNARVKEVKALEQQAASQIFAVYRTSKLAKKRSLVLRVLMSFEPCKPQSMSYRQCNTKSEKTLKENSMTLDTGNHSDRWLTRRLVLG